MIQHPILILNDPAVRAALKQAWQESKPGVSGGHEEGGFILRDTAGNLSVAQGAFYGGEFVISMDKVYLITPNGQVSEIGNSRDIAG